jgi:hypothetical protein
MKKFLIICFMTQISDAVPILDVYRYVPPILTPAGDYPANDTPGEKVAQRALIEMNVFLDSEYGLVLPDTSTPEKVETLRKKISPNLQETMKRIEAAKDEGKRIVYMPGSFDLTHKGHAFYVQQVIECFTSAAGCSRNDIFIVMLADSDDLISRVKATKYIENGGSELQKRPVESAAERVIGMAALGVDVVGIIPSSKDNREVLPVPIDLDIDKMIEELEANFVEQNMSRLQALQLSAEAFEVAKKRVITDKQELRIGLDAYKQLLKNFSEGTALEDVPVQAWQLYITSILNSALTPASANTKGYQVGSMTRLVSRDDTKYVLQVIFLMTHANVAVNIINDTNNGSTSGLLSNFQETYGEYAWQAIRDAKLRKIRERFGDNAVDNLNKLTEEISKSLNL